MLETLNLREALCVLLAVEATFQREFVLDGVLVDLHLDGRLVLVRVVPKGRQMLEAYMNSILRSI